MRLVPAGREMAAAWRDAASEALNAFSDSRLYLEKYLERPRHIEIQIIGDSHGNFVYLGERECSVQRRHQKVIEESPSPVMTPDLRRRMGEAAVRLAKEAGYANAGTVEFLVEASGNFYFLEVNTRLQVEHPVTEMITGLDLVKLQIRVAAGEPIPFSQADVSLSGHAVECRLYAEDPENQFFPSPGKILLWRAPSGPGIRVDDGVSEGFRVSTEYDPMLGKLIAWGRDRGEAIARLDRALLELRVSGIKTNGGLLLRILRDPEFRRGEIYTQWLDERLPQLLGDAKTTANDRIVEDAAIVAAMLHFVSAKDAASAHHGAPRTESRWKRQARLEQTGCSE